MKPSIVLAGVFLAAASILAACEDDLVLVQAQTRQVEIEKQKPEEAVPDGLVLTQPWPATSNEKARGSEQPPAD